MNAATNAVVASCDFDRLVAERDAVVRAAERVAEIIGNAPAGFPRLYVDSRGSRADFDMATVRDNADRGAWSQLIHQSGLWSFMDHTARESWRQQIERGKVPPFTRDAAEATVAGIHAERGAMVKRSVESCFSRLSGHYKTNRPDAFGRRMILTHILSLWGTGANRSHTVNHRACDDLDDLIRVLSLLRGLPEPDHRSGAWHVLNRREEAHLSRAWPRDVEFEYFFVRLFKNGNGHVEFRHDEDVRRLNAVLSMATGGSAIAGARRPARWW